MNKKMTIFNLALLVLVGGFSHAKAAESKKKEEVETRKDLVVAAEIVQDVYDNAVSLALKMTIADQVMFSSLHNYAPYSLNLFCQVARTGVMFFKSCSNAVWLLIAAKYCSSASMDYGLKALLLAVGQYAVETGLPFYHQMALPVVGRLPNAIYYRLNTLGQLALIVAVAKCAVCIVRKTREYANSKPNAAQNKDVGQQAGLDVAA